MPDSCPNPGDTSVSIYTGRAILPAGSQASATYDYHIIGITLRGTVQYGGASTSFTAEAGDVVLMDPHVKQHWTVPPATQDNQEDWELLYCIFAARPYWLDWLRFSQIIPGHARLRMKGSPVQRKICFCFSKMLRSNQGLRSHDIDFQFNYLEQLILWCNSYNRDQRRKLDPRIRVALDYLVTHLHTRITLDHLARQCHLSRARLAALFCQQVGAPPMQYLEIIRIERSMQLLTMTVKSINEISLEVGFSDVTYFCNRFKRRLGMTPRGYREQNRRRIRSSSD